MTACAAVAAVLFFAIVKQAASAYDCTAVEDQILQTNGFITLPTPAELNDQVDCIVKYVKANNDLLLFPRSFYVQTVVPSVTLSRPIVIDAPGIALYIYSGLDADGNPLAAEVVCGGASSAFFVRSSNATLLSAMNVTGCTESAIVVDAPDYDPRVSNAYFTLAQVTVYGNKGDAGAGLRVVRGQAFITSVEFTNNEASYGAAISIATGSLITGISESQFSGNSAIGSAAAPAGPAGMGGAIYVSPGACLYRIDNTTFEGNSAAQGGAVAFAAVPTNCSWRDVMKETTDPNTLAPVAAGAVTRVLTNVSVYGSVLSGNAATRQGGALWVYQEDTGLVASNTFQLDSCLLKGNTAKHTGGALFARANHGVALFDCVMDSNSAGAAGGAVWFESLNLGFLLVNGTGRGSAPGYAPGMVLVNNSVVLGQAMYSELHSDGARALFGAGGALAATGDIQLAVNNVTFAQNRAQAYGGGLACHACINVDVRRTSFLSNSAGLSGGGFSLPLPAGKSAIASSTFRGNRAGGAVNFTYSWGAGTGVPPDHWNQTVPCGGGGGGGMCLQSMSRPFSFTGVSFSDNVAGFGGGLFVDTALCDRLGIACPITFTNVSLTNNSATGEGGGIYVAGGQGVRDLPGAEECLGLLEEGVPPRQGCPDLLVQGNVGPSISSAQNVGSRPALLELAFSSAAATGAVAGPEGSGIIAVVNNNEMFAMSVSMSDALGKPVSLVDSPVLLASTALSDVAVRAPVVLTTSGNVAVVGLSVYGEQQVQAVELAAYVKGDKVANTTFNVQVRQCRVGEVTQENICVSCANEYGAMFSFNPQNNTCDSCPGDAETCGPSLIVPSDGNWMSDPRNPQMIGCPGYSCAYENRSEILLELAERMQGQENPSQSDIDAFMAAQCAEGYYGHICGNCAWPGYGNSAGWCVECLPVWLNALLVAILLVFNMAVLYSAIVLKLRRSVATPEPEPEPEDARRSSSGAGATKGGTPDSLGGDVTDITIPPAAEEEGAEVQEAKKPEAVKGMAMRWRGKSAAAPPPPLDASPADLGGGEAAAAAAVGKVGTPVAGDKTAVTQLNGVGHPHAANGTALQDLMAPALGPDPGAGRDPDLAPVLGPGTAVPGPPVLPSPGPAAEAVALSGPVPVPGLVEGPGPVAEGGLWRWKGNGQRDDSSPDQQADSDGGKPSVVIPVADLEGGKDIDKEGEDADKASGRCAVPLSHGHRAWQRTLRLLHVAEEPDKELASNILDTIITYVQMLGLLASVSVSMPDYMSTFVARIDITTITTRVANIDCLFRLWDPYNSAFAVTIVDVVTPMVFGLIGYGGWSAWYYAGKKRRERLATSSGALTYWTYIRQNMLITVLQITLFFYANFTSAALNLFSCYELDQPGQPYAEVYAKAIGFYWLPDPSKQCLEGTELALALGLGLPVLIIISVGVPLAAVLFLYFNRHRLGDDSFEGTYGELYSGFTRQCYWWGSMNFAQLLLLTVATQCLVLFGPGMVLVVMMMTLTVQLVLQYKFDPMASLLLNHLTIIPLVAMLVSCYCMLAMIQFDDGQGFSAALPIIIMTLNLGVLAYLVMHFVIAVVPIVQDVTRKSRVIVRALSSAVSDGGIKVLASRKGFGDIVMQVRAEQKAGKLSRSGTAELRRNDTASSSVMNPDSARTPRSATPRDGWGLARNRTRSGGEVKWADQGQAVPGTERSADPGQAVPGTERSADQGQVAVGTERSVDQGQVVPGTERSADDEESLATFGWR